MNIICSEIYAEILRDKRGEIFFIYPLESLPTLSTGEYDTQLNDDILSSQMGIPL